MEFVRKTRVNIIWAIILLVLKRYTPYIYISYNIFVCVLLLLMHGKSSKIYMLYKNMKIEARVIDSVIDV